MRTAKSVTFSLISKFQSQYSQIGVLLQKLELYQYVDNLLYKKPGRYYHPFEFY